MSEPTFFIILEAIRSKIEKEDTNFRKVIPEEERLFLYKEQIIGMSTTRQHPQSTC